jgi:hypothetical protein
MPGATSQYLTRGLTPARLSNAYSTAGIPVGAPQGGNALNSSFTLDTTLLTKPTQHY